MRHDIEVKFVSDYRKARHPPDPAYPTGIDIDLTDGAKVACWAKLPYPAECCGVWLVRCRKCGSRNVITAAGRIDDPRSVKIPCKEGRIA